MTSHSFTQLAKAWLTQWHGRTQVTSARKAVSTMWSEGACTTESSSPEQYGSEMVKPDTTQ